MLIRDLEFINVADTSLNSSAIKGGAFAHTDADVDVHNNSIDADAGAIAIGDKTKAIVGTEAKIFSNKHYTAGYGYAKGVATARTGSHYAYSVNYDTGIVH